MTRNHALVIGAGIAGPAAAMALQRVGIEATCYEAYAGTAHGVGSFMSIATNGLDALRTLDAHEGVTAAAFPTPRMVLWSGTGKRLGEVENGPALADGTVSMTMNRADLYAALHEEAGRRSIRFEYGKRLTDVRQTADEAVATFADGTETRGDLVVGADGMRSRTRELIDPSAPRPRYAGLLNTGGYAVHGADKIDVDRTPGAFHMMFGKRAFFGYAIRDDGTIWWFANEPYPSEPTATDLAAVPPAEHRRRLLGLFADDALPAAEIIEATDHDLSFSAMHEMAAPKTWHNGRMVLVGDAAHVTTPSSGQGASLAVEDALELARCLRDLPDPPAALAAYQRIRHDRVEGVRAQAARINRDKAAGPVGRAIRDAVMPLVLKRFAKTDGFAWMYRHHIPFDERLPVA